LNAHFIASQAISSAVGILADLHRIQRPCQCPPLLRCPKRKQMRRRHSFIIFGPSLGIRTLTAQLKRLECRHNTCKGWSRFTGSNRDLYFTKVVCAPCTPKRHATPSPFWSIGARRAGCILPRPDWSGCRDSNSVHMAWKASSYRLHHSRMNGGVLGSRTHLGPRGDRVTAGRGTSPLMTRHGAPQAFRPLEHTFGAADGSQTRTYTLARCNAFATPLPLCLLERSDCQNSPGITPDQLHPLAGSHAFLA
jgi:hypothetical protein